MINILFEDNHILVVEKPINIPVQEDISRDKDFLSMIKEYIKNKYKKPGNVYVGLVHRLDRPVGGLMVFAKTSKAASRLSEQIRQSNISKHYLAVLEGKLEPKEGTLKDKLLKDEKNNIVKVDENGKEAILNYKVLEYVDNKTLVDVDLVTGRSHQIRVQFSSRGYPLYGDQKYNINVKEKEQIALYAYKLSFDHPTTKEHLNFEYKPKDIYPWNIFKI